MVHIKKLVIQGFKSFGPKRISIELERGFVVVTGPNGGGKSNILDAIRFALGELSAHNLRVGRMAEIVHDNPSTSWAKTSITFDNSEKVLPIDSEEVTISRKITKTGESEYYVNGRQVSRNDLLTLLSMANIKPTGFNIVPQGSVIEIAEMSGSELRRMLEDVAGISDYEKKKAEAEEQLAIAEKNLAIAKAGTKEVKIRVKQLEKERNQAYRRRRVEEFLNAIKRLRLEHGIKLLEGELRDIDEQLLNIERKTLELQNEKDQLLSVKNNLNAEIGALSQKLEEVDSELSRLQSEKTSLESEINGLRIGSSVLEERSMRMLREKEYLLERIRNLVQGLGELEAKMIDGESSLKNLTSKLEEKKRELEILFRDLKIVEEQYLKLRSEIEREEGAIKGEKLKWEIELSKSKTRYDEINKTICEISSEIIDLSKTSHEKIPILLDSWARLREKKRQKEEILGELSKIEASLNHLTRRLSDVESVLWQLSRILEKIASSGILRKSEDNVKLLEAMRIAGVNGVRGFLKDAIVADESGYKLLESAIGEWIESLIVDSWDLGMKLAELLSECGISAKIISLDIAASHVNNVKIPGIVFKEKWADIALRYLIKDVDFSGKDYALGEKKVVTRHIIIYPDLRIETTTPDKAALSEVLNMEYGHSIKLLEKLRDIVQDMNARINHLRGEIAKKEDELEKMNSEINYLTQWSWNSYFQSSEAVLKEIKNLLKLRQLEEELAEVVEKIRIAEETLKKIPDPRGSHYEELKKLEEELREKHGTYERNRLGCAELEVEIKGIQKQLESLRREREKILEEESRLKQQITQIDEERRQVLMKYEDTVRKIEGLEGQLNEKSSKLEELVKAKSELRAKLNEFSGRIGILNSRIEQIENEFQRLSPTKTSLQVRRAQLEMQLKNLHEKMESIGSTGIEFPNMGEELLSRLEEELEKELRELEMVNQLAPAQYEEIIGNYKLRSSRIMELEAERMEIIRFIEWVEGEKKRIFMETFNRVAEAFENYFTQLTGGKGWLKLENPDNLFEGGIEMILAFPGKQPRSVRAASGGEKSVAAVALLLALQGLTPADFYIFDEVDAHMDLQYTNRLAELFKEMAKRTQIIVISLKDVVVENADQVIGVYNSGGVSRIVKTKLEEVVKSG